MNPPAAVHCMERTDPANHETSQRRRGGLIGVSAQIQRVYRAVRHVSASDYPVLIVGERGTEKEQAARTIHALGPRRNRTFLAVDCACLPPTLVEAELFGYAKGAFFAAPEGKWGRLALAGEGTVFLDEIDTLPLSFQAKLLRTIQEGRFLPVGAVHPMPFQARVIAATCHDLQLRSEAGKFREDLHLQLNVVPIRLPALRERKEDILLLADLFAEKYAAQGQSRVEFSDGAIDYLTSNSWPGNVRELEDTVRHAVSNASDGIVRVNDLSGAVQGELGGEPMEDEEPISFDDFERQAIHRAMRKAAGDRNVAARLLGVGKSALDRKLKQYGVPESGGQG